MQPSFIRSIMEIISGTRYHFNKVCIPAWKDVYNSFLQEAWPYSVVIKNLLSPVMVSFENDFCRGVFSNSLKDIDKELSRRIIFIYLCYAVYLFTITKFCRDLSALDSNFNSDKLWKKVLSIASDCKPTKLKIEESKNAGGDPIAGLYLTLSEIVEEGTGRNWKGSGAKWLSLPVLYLQRIHVSLDNLEKDLLNKNGSEFT